MRVGLKSQIAILLFGLLLLSTGMTSFVILSFWLREATTSFTREKELAMSLLAERHFYRSLNAGNGAEHGRSFIEQSLATTGAMAGCIKKGDGAVVCLGEDIASASAALGEMSTLAKPQSIVQRLGGRQWVGLVPGNQYLDLAMQLNSFHASPVPVLLRFALEPRYARILSLQRYIAVYLGINLIILLVIGFFRLRETILRPVERLQQLTISYRDEHGVPFLALQEANELAQLYTSMQQMLGRINADREKLQQHVASLEQANQQLSNTREEMIRAEKLSSVGRLAAGLAHEIGNPVGIVQGYLALMSPNDVDPEERREFCTRAEQELQRVSQLIRQLLDFARPSSGREQLVEPHAVLDEALALLKPQPLFDGIVIECQYAKQEMTLWCDPAHLLQVLLNCLMNAADAIHSVDKPGHLLVSTACHGTDDAKFIRLSIADNGCGLHDNELNAVFDPFFTTKAPGKGTGLGLSVSYALLQSMGGSISLVNRPEGGAVVTIDLPLTETQFSGI